MPGIPLNLPAKASVPFKRFLLPLISQADVHAKVVDLMAVRTLESLGASVGADDRAWKRARKSASQSIYRLTCTPEALKPYPTKEKVEETAHALRGEHSWAWPPVLFYASGWLDALVQVTATVNLRKIPPSKLALLLAELPACVEGEPGARALWTLTGSESEAFPALADAIGLLEGRAVGDDELAIALALSGHYELRFDLLRERVLGALVSWADKTAKAQTGLGERLA